MFWQRVFFLGTELVRDEMLFIGLLCHFALRFALKGAGGEARTGICPMTGGFSPVGGGRGYGRNTRDSCLLL